MAHRIRTYAEMVEAGDWPPTAHGTAMFAVGVLVGGVIVAAAAAATHAFGAWWTTGLAACLCVALLADTYYTRRFLRAAAPRVPAFLERTIVSRRPEDDGHGEAVLLDCGHRVVMIPAPTGNSAPCAQCLDNLREASR